MPETDVKADNSIDQRKFGSQDDNKEKCDHELSLEKLRNLGATDKFVGFCDNCEKTVFISESNVETKE